MIFDKSRVLVTTALEESWPEEKPVLFLGEWCRLYSRRDRWFQMQAPVVPYHWDDRTKLYRDFLQLQAFNEQLLQELARELNRIHGVNHSLRYWRILIGYWLNLFTGVVFDRWEMVQRAVATGSVAGSLYLTIPQDQVVAHDTADFVERILDDPWNHVLYARLMKGWSDIPLAAVPYQAGSEHLGDRALHNGLPRRIKRWLAKHYARFCGAIARPDECFFISTYLPLREDFKLQRRLGQMPKLWRLPSAPRARLNEGHRRWRLGTGSQGHVFGDMIRTLITEQLPTIFLEGYSDLCRCVKQLPWPGRPKLIFTSNSHFTDDVFKAWAADKVDAGSKLVIGEHGGYGVGLFNGGGSFQMSIGDAFLSWGWRDDRYAHIKPVGILKMTRWKPWDPSGGALVVMGAMPRYSFDLRSMAIAGQMLNYFEDQFRFVENLPAAIQGQLIIRLYPHDYEYSQKKRWQDRCAHVRLDDGAAPMRQLISQSRLFISTYNTTTYLESLVMNMPTVIFWNPNHWELSESAIPCFEELKRVGIFHETPESAARHVAAVWDDVNAWWRSRDVCHAVQNFCECYALLPDDLLDRVETALRDSMQQTQPHQIMDKL